MVQEFIPMKYEHRFVVIDRRVITSSPVAWHLTPLNVENRTENYETPKSTSPNFFVSHNEEQHELAQVIAEEMATPHAIIDIAMHGDQPVAIEFNPCVIGAFGLYACDPYAIAKASEKIVSALSTKQAEDG